MNNEKIKDKIRKSSVKQWQVADSLGIAETTLCKYLRKPVSEELESQIMEAIKRLEERNEA